MIMPGANGHDAVDLAASDTIHVIPAPFIAVYEFGTQEAQLEG